MVKYRSIRLPSALSLVCLYLICCTYHGLNCTTGTGAGTGAGTTIRGAGFVTTTGGGVRSITSGVIRDFSERG